MRAAGSGQAQAQSKGGSAAGVWGSGAGHPDFGVKRFPGMADVQPVGDADRILEDFIFHLKVGSLNLSRL